MKRIDVHQHVWTAPLVQRLMARRTPPMIRRSGELTVLYTDAERPYLIDLEAEAPERRAALLRADGVECAVVAASSPIGIEALPREQANALIDAHLDGVAALGDAFLAWGPLALDGAGADGVDTLIARGAVGISLPAGALATPRALASLDEVLERTAAHGRALFVHPGPGLARPGAAAPAAPGDGEPDWWPALTGYVAQMQAAWLTFTAFGRARHPDLGVVFAMLAGCAPMLAERLVQRGGPSVALRDPRILYDTSSYGPAAVEAITLVVGEDQLVYGSDRPMARPAALRRQPALQENAALALSGIGAAA